MSRPTKLWWCTMTAVAVLMATGLWGLAYHPAGDRDLTAGEMGEIYGKQPIPVPLPKCAFGCFRWDILVDCQGTDICVACNAQLACADYSIVFTNETQGSRTAPDLDTMDELIQVQRKKDCKRYYTCENELIDPGLCDTLVPMCRNSHPPNKCRRCYRGSFTPPPSEVDDEYCTPCAP